MGILFNLLLAYSNRFGSTPKLIKALRATGDPKDAEAARLMQNDLDELKRNPPKNMQEMLSRAVEKVNQTSRDLRIAGRHDEADRAEKIIEYTQETMMSKPKDKPKDKPKS